MRIRKSRLFFSLGLFLSFWSMSTMCFGYSAVVLVEKLILKAGTPVLLRVERSLNSAYANVGDPVDLMVIREVKVDGKIVIKSGTRARGEVTEVEKKGAVGKPGMISIVVKSVEGIGDTNVPLRATLTKEGKNNLTTSILVALLCILGLFLIKGGQGVVTAGSEIKAYVDFDVEFEM